MLIIVLLNVTVWTKDGFQVFRGAQYIIPVERLAGSSDTLVLTYETMWHSNSKTRIEISLLWKPQMFCASNMWNCSIHCRHKSCSHTMCMFCGTQHQHGLFCSFLCMMFSASCSYFNKAFLFQATLPAQLYHTDSFLCNFIRAAFQLHCSWMSHQFRLPHHYISLPHNFISPTMVITSSFHVTQHVVALSFHPPPPHIIWSPPYFFIILHGILDSNFSPSYIQ